MSLSGGLGPFLGSAGQRAGAAGQGAAPAGTPVVGAPQQLGPARPRPLHPRAARGGTSVCLDWPLCPLVCGLHRQTPLPFKALVAVVPVRGRLREAVVFPFLHIFPFLSRRLVTLSWALPASLLWRPRCRASGLLACLRAAPFSPPAHSSSLGRRGGRAHLLRQLHPSCHRGRVSHPYLQTPRRGRAPAPASGPTLEPGGQQAPGLDPLKPSESI